MTDPDHSYLSDFIQSPRNVGGVLAGLAASILVSFPYGLEGAVLPLLATLACEFVACMFVPDMASFRAWSNAKRAREQRAEAEERAFSEIKRRFDILYRAQQNNAGNESKSNDRRQDLAQRFTRLRANYASIVEQVDSLLRQATERPGVLGRDDVERISNVPLEFLGLHLSMLVMEERASSTNLVDINRKLGVIQQQISQPDAGSDLRALTRARDEYEGLISRHQRMVSKRTAIEAALVALPDQLAEIYQVVMSEATDSDNSRLTDAIANLRLRQDIELELNDEISGAITDSATRKTSQTNPVRSDR